MDRPERITQATRVIDDGDVIRVIGIGAQHTPATVVETFAAVQELSGSDRMPILFDARDWGEIELPSWVQFVSNIERVCLAAAVLVEPDDLTQYVGIFPDVVDRLVIPFRVFEEEADALAFLARRTTR